MEERRSPRGAEATFLVQTSGVAGELPPAAENPVTGDQDADGVAANRSAYRLGGHSIPAQSVSCLPGKLPIGPALPVGNFQQQIPDQTLKRGALGRQRKVYGGGLPGEIPVQPLSGLQQRGVGTAASLGRAVHPDAGEARFVTGQQKMPHRAFVVQIQVHDVLLLVFLSIIAGNRRKVYGENTA